MVRQHFWRAALVVFGLIALVAPSASAGPGVAGPNIKVSGASPFASCTADAGQTGTNFLNSEVEPSVAVSTVDRNADGVPDRIGAYQQDRWDNGGARGIVASVFFQGAWHQVVIPGVSKCSGGSFDRATDQWVTIAPNGGSPDGARRFRIATISSRNAMVRPSRHSTARPSLDQRQNACS